MQQLTKDEYHQKTELELKKIKALNGNQGGGGKKLVR